ncbi:MAG: type VI secretion system tip protein TssI/VgrG, partial [Planctomycetota bacterium]|nr:type VI secretion system tip protein TssI/VgrG [Planctomycetota bacterium]
EPWEYCVQYRETAFQFVSRLMEHEGIYFYFIHEEHKHTLVLCDGIDSHGPVEGQATIFFLPPSENVVRDESVFEWATWREFQPAKAVLRDYYFETPATDLTVTLKSKLSPSQGSQEIFDYPGSFRKSGHGEHFSKIRVETWESQAEQVSLRSDARGLAAGWLFTLADHHRDDQNREYLIVASRYEIETHITRSRGAATIDLDYVSQHRVIPSATPFRPERLTVKPTVHGPQTAVIVGPQGDEIYSDKYGRVKVQFHWDRVGKLDQDSSCWIRVSQTWAGKKWGAVFLPRIGQEVLVDFLEGDPDQPIITGAVYNADQMPPYALPDNQTKSGLKTHSTKEGTDETYNELRFEDKKGAEEIYFHAERDFLRIVENNDVLKVGLEVKDAGDQTIVIHNNQSITIGNKDSKDGSQKSVIWKDQSITIGKDQTIKIGFGGDGSSKRSKSPKTAP